MLKNTILVCLLLACSAKSEVPDSPYKVSQEVEVLCYKGIEYITKNDWKNGYTVAVDKYNKPITCTSK